MPVTTVNGLRAHHEISGPDDGRPLVLAHALGLDLRVWDALLPLLPPDVRVLRYDLRGHGLSDAPEGDYFMGDLVADAAGLIEATGFRGAVIIGLSIGGVVAQGLAAERRDLLAGAVLACTAAKIGTEAGWRDRMDLVRAGGIEAIAEGVLEKWFGRAFRRDRAAELAIWRDRLAQTPVAGYLGCCAAMADTDLRLSTAGLRLPALAVAGSEDGSTPPDLVRETAETIPGARFALIRGAGHMPPIERPEALAGLIAGFLDEIDAA
jgi:3-oxoadipate enol-lactonase